MVAVAGGWPVSLAGADGDPASDVLAAAPLFLPQDAGVAAKQGAQLLELLRKAAGRGYAIRVALIASAADLGSVTALWRQPAAYARFLGQELSLLYRGPLLVVMPNGFGLYNAPAGPAARSALATAPRRTGLGIAAVTAIRALARAAGRPLALPAAGRTPAGHAGPDSVAWMVFAAGLVVIAIAWAASFRARPPRWGGRRSRATGPS